MMTISGAMINITKPLCMREPIQINQQMITPSQIPQSKDDRFREWIEEAEIWQETTDAKSTSWLRDRPILIVGLGDPGLKVLDYVVNHLRGRFGLQWTSVAEHVRLLHIGISDTMLDEYRGIRHINGYPSITLVLDRERKRRMSWHSGLNWFDKDSVKRPLRSFGRLGVFASLAEGTVESYLWSAIQAAVGSFNQISAYIVADSFSDDASGMIADIAHLLRCLLYTSPSPRDRS